MMKKTHALASLAVIFTSVLFSAAARADQSVKFKFSNTYNKETAQQVERVWKTIPEYHEFFNTIKWLPSIQIGEADVNDDGTPEIFVTHADPEQGFCDKANWACPFYVYANTDKGLVQLGRFNAPALMIVSTHITNKVHDLVTYTYDDKMQTYVWNGKQYQLK